MLIENLNATVESFVASDDGMVVEEKIENGTYDIYGTPFGITTERAMRFDFSDVLYESKILIIVRRADDTLSSMWDLFNIFSGESWLAIFGAFLLYTLLCVFISATEQKFMHRASLKPLNVSLQTNGYEKSFWKLCNYQIFLACLPHVALATL